MRARTIARTLPRIHASALVLTALGASHSASTLRTPLPPARSASVDSARYNLPHDVTTLQRAVGVATRRTSLQHALQHALQPALGAPLQRSSARASPRSLIRSHSSNVRATHRRGTAGSRSAVAICRSPPRYACKHTCAGTARESEREGRWASGLADGQEGGRTRAGQGVRATHRGYPGISAALGGERGGVNDTRLFVRGWERAQVCHVATTTTNQWCNVRAANIHGARTSCIAPTCPRVKATDTNAQGARSPTYTPRS